ncbi:MAG TPA: sigma factor [Phycisphaerales bacterium]|nr:sigma factor [Phycisphaerales bacterium]HMP36553.1 sigma factor [Phycisphaerales bacterium]
MSWETTTILLERLRAFDDAAWRDFSERFRTPIAAFARRNGLDAEAAQDVAQEALAAAAEGVRAGRYERGRGRLSAWLFGIAWNEAMRRRRDDRFERQSPSIAGRTTFFSALPSEAAARTAWDHEWERFVLDRCMSVARGEFTDRVLAIFDAVAIRAVDPALVAREFGVTRNAVFIAKHRVLRRLRELRESIEAEEAA